MRHLSEFVLSEGKKYQSLEPAQDDILQRKAEGSFEDGLDGWSYMMRNNEKDLALLYFENKSVLPVLEGFIPDSSYSLMWFDPMTGEWEKALTVKSNNKGSLSIPSFPDSENPSVRDWALKIKK
jgi:hypothetical protein